MAKWSVLLSAYAEAELAGLTKSIQEDIVGRFAWFAENFDSLPPVPLHADWRGYYKLRVGDYRIAYKINYESHLLLIERIRHRSVAYKKKGRK